MKILTSINPDMAKRAESVLKSRLDPDKLHDDFIQRHFAYFRGWPVLQQIYKALIILKQSD